MEVRVAESAGFCFGVERAVSLVEKLLEEGRKPLYTYGPIIHNEQVVGELAERGVQVLNGIRALEEAEKGTVVIRSHGASRAEQDRMQELGFDVIDATCPFVKKIHRMAQEAEEQGKTVFIAGDRDHPEVKAIVGWCREAPYVIGEESDIPLLDPKTPVMLLSQTTFNQNKFKKLVEIVRDKYYNADVVNTICHATQKRQREAKELSARADAMIVIGSRQSSNTKKLVQICEAYCAKTYFVQTLADLKQQAFHPVRFVGITAGASTPKNIIEEVQNFVRGEF